MNLRLRIAAYGFAAVAVLLAVLLGIRGAGRTRLSPAGTRQPMPPLVLSTLDGGSWRLEDHRSQVVVVNYWASWCAACWEETPGLIRVAREEGPKGLSMVGVAMDEGGQNAVDKVRAFVQRFGVPYPVARPQPMSQMAYGLGALPVTILIDRNGRVAKISYGAVSEGTLRADVESLLAE